ncbi:MAG TPA: hypothetical protein VG944_09295 [Fimbriimonas sp.]|nr:hypothetical protein [Fimbriimonas sp.]
MNTLLLSRSSSRLFGALAGLFALAGLAGAQTNANVGTSITIAKYVAINATGAPLTINVTDGGAALTYVSNTVTFTVNSNTNYSLSGAANGNSVSGYTGPGTLKISNYTPPASMVAGTTSGTFNVTLTLTAYTGATPTSGANTSGTVTLTVTAS